MTTAIDLERIRWALAERLLGMRKVCPDPLTPDEQLRDGLGHWGNCLFIRLENELACRGYVPVPLTAEGMVDEGRLRRVLKDSPVTITYDGRTWMVWAAAIAKGEDLATAYLRAVRAEGF